MAEDSRRILHCDMDCFYAAVHIRDDPSLRGLPVVVGGDPDGRGVIAAASYEARKFGVHSAMPSATAVRLCPNLVFMDSDFGLYRQESEKIFDIYARYTPKVQTLGLDEAYLDVTEHLGEHGTATAIAKDIRRAVFEEVRLTVSIGVGPTPLVAKIASDYHKPDGLTVVPPERVEAFLDPLPVRRIPGVGPSTEKVLHGLGIRTIADLRFFDAATLAKRLGRRAGMLQGFAEGRDRRVVEPWSSSGRKSLSHERTYREDLQTLDEMSEQLEHLSTLVGEGLAKRNIFANTITIKVRYGDFTTITRSKTLRSPTKNSEMISATALELLERTEAARRPVRLLGVGAHNLIHEGDPAQLSLFE